MKMHTFALICAFTGLPLCDAGTDCESPISHGPDCTHTKRNPNQKACGTGGQTCNGAPIFTCVTTTFTYYNLFPDGCVACTTIIKNEQNCWAEHTNCDQVNAPCSQTYRCTWDNIQNKCVSDPNTGSAWTQALKPTHTTCL